MHCVELCAQPYVDRANEFVVADTTAAAVAPRVGGSVVTWSDDVIGMVLLHAIAIPGCAGGEVSISDVVQAINPWTAGHYYWDAHTQQSKPRTQP